MSQVYQIRLASNVTQTLRATDRMRHRVELTDILDEKQMKDLLREVLKEEGWTEGEGGKTFTKEGPNGEKLVWDLEKDEVSATVEREREVSTDVAATGYGESQNEARADAQRALERQRARAEGHFAESEQALEQEITEALEASESDRLRDLNGVLQRVYSEALKRKAQQLGTVMSVQESQNGDDYELVIHISE